LESRHLHAPEEEACRGGKKVEEKVHEGDVKGAPILRAMIAVQEGLKNIIGARIP